MARHANTLLAWFSVDGPRWPYVRVWLHALIGAIGLTGAVWTGCSALEMAPSEIFAENAAHELLQSFVLGAALVAGVVALILARGLGRFAAFVTGVVSYIGFFREMPTCRGDVAVFCETSATRGSLMAIGALAIIVAAVVFELRTRGTIIKAVHPRLSWPLALAAVLVGASQISEILHLVAVEETLELYSYLVLMLSAGWLALRPMSLQSAGRADSTLTTGGSFAAKPEV